MPRPNIFGNAFSMSKSLKALSDGILTNYYLDKGKYPSEEDFINDMLEARKKSQESFNYKQFCDKLDSKDAFNNFPKLEESERNKKEELSKQAAISMTKIVYRGSYEVPPEVSKVLGGAGRNVCAVLQGTPNEAALKIIKDGSSEEIGSLFEKAFEKLLAKLPDPSKALTDEELVEQWPELSGNIQPLVSEYKNVLGFLEQKGASISEGLKAKIESTLKKIGPYYDYYDNRLQDMSGEFYSYMPDNISEIVSENDDMVDAFEDVFEEAGISRSIGRTTDAINVPIADAVLNKCFINPKTEITEIYLDTGASINPKDTSGILRAIKNGQKLIVYGGDSETPVVISSDLTFPPKTQKFAFEPEKYPTVTAQRAKALEERKKKVNETQKQGSKPAPGVLILDDLAERFSLLPTASGELNKIVESFASLYESLRLDGEKKLNAEEAKSVKEKLGAYLNSANEFLNNYGKAIPADLKVVLRDSQLPLKSCLNALEEGKTINDALGDLSWLKDVFNTDPFDGSQIEKPRTVEFDKNNPEKSQIDQYKATLEYMQRYYNASLIHICGDSENPDETLKYKASLLDMAYTKAAGNNYETYFKYLYQSVMDMKKLFVTDDAKQIADNAIVNSHYFELLAHANGLFSIADGVSFNSGSKRTEAAKMLAEFANLFKPKPEKFGLDKKGNFKELNNCTLFSDSISRFDNEIRSYWGAEDYKTRYPLADEKDPLHGIYVKGNEIKQKIADYMSGKEDAPCPGYKDYEEFLKQMEAFILNKDNFIDKKENQYNADITAITTLLDKDYKDFELYNKAFENDDEAFRGYPAEFKTYVKSMMNRIAETLDAFKQKQIEFAEEKLKNYFSDTTTVYEQTAVNSFITVACGNELIPNEFSNILRCQRFLDEDNVRQGRIGYLKEALTNQQRINDVKAQLSPMYQGTQNEVYAYKRDLKELILASVIEKQASRAQEDNGYGTKVSKTAGEKMQKMLVGDLAFEEIYDLAKELTENLNKNPGIQTLINSKPEDIKAFLEGDDLGTRIEELAIGDNNYLKNIDQEKLEVFDQRKNGIIFFGDNGIGYKNSPEFNAIKTELEAVNKKMRSFVPVPAEDYVKLYKACAEYLNQRSPEASTERGRERFSAAADIMLSLGLQLREKLPDMRETIDRDLRNTAVRSAEFRNNLFEMTSNKDPKTATLNAFAKAAKEQLKDKNVTTRIKNEEQRASFLNKYESINACYVKPETAENVIKPSIEYAAREIRDAVSNGNMEKVAGRIVLISYLKTVLDSMNDKTLSEFTASLDKAAIAPEIEKQTQLARDFLQELPDNMLEYVIENKGFEDDLIAGFDLYKEKVKDLDFSEIQKNDTSKERTFDTKQISNNKGGKVM